MTIYDIKRLTAETSPYFFSTQTLKFFGQTMKSFSVQKCTDGKYLISAPIKERTTGRRVGYTQRYFNPITNTMELVS